MLSFNYNSNSIKEFQFLQNLYDHKRITEILDKLPALCIIYDQIAITIVWCVLLLMQFHHSTIYGKKRK